MPSPVGPGFPRTPAGGASVSHGFVPVGEATIPTPSADPAGGPPPGPVRPDYGFPKARRVRRPADYRRLQASAQRYRVPGLVVLYAPSRGGSGSRLGLTVSRKVGPSVLRNRVKRVLREVFRLRRPTLQHGWDVVVIARPEAAALTGPQLRERFLGAMDYLDRLSSPGRRRGPSGAP